MLKDSLNLMKPSNPKCNLLNKRIIKIYYAIKLTSMRFENFYKAQTIKINTRETEQAHNKKSLTRNLNFSTKNRFR